MPNSTPAEGTLSGPDAEQCITSAIRTFATHDANRRRRANPDANRARNDPAPGSEFGEVDAMQRFYIERELHQVRYYAVQFLSSVLENTTELALTSQLMNSTHSGVSRQHQGWAAVTFSDTGG
jgi:hypothetical protein